VVAWLLAFISLIDIQIHVPRVWTDPSVRPKQWKRDMTFGTRNLKSLYRSGSLTIAARKLSSHKLDVVGVQEVQWDKRGTVRAGDYFFICNR
jgi:hypothetical protein